MRKSVTLLAAALFAALPAGATAQDHAGHHGAHAAMSDSAAVAAVLADFHGALTRGDTAAVLALLAPDARILEGGGIETVEEYASHHLPADMAFAQAVERMVEPPQVIVHGDVAWAASTSRATGRYRDRDIDSRGAELAVLVRGPEGWRIAALHWSSR